MDIELKDRRLCARCVQEPYLKDIIETSGEEVDCDYCDFHGRSLALEEVAALIEKAFGQHYEQITANDDFDKLIGEELSNVIADAAEISEDCAEDIREIIDNKTSGAPDEQYGDDPFNADACYARKSPDDIYYQEKWHYFEHSIKTRARFFSRTGYDTLKEVFAELDAYRTYNRQSVIVEAGSEQGLKSLYRARVFQSEEKLKEALMRPDRQISPPDTAHALAGRMNARGISVFYGATKPETALAELRPPVCSDVVIGRFDIIKKVRLLDVGALAGVKVDGSIFDPSYIKRLERAKFLRSLSNRITRPVLPDDELSEYLVTQAIADFLATELKLDGVIYCSAQSKEGINVALFNHASCVELYEMPKGTTIEASTYNTDDDGPYRDYSVHETLPPKSTPQPKHEHFWGFGKEVEMSAPISSEPFLKLDMESLRVHHVASVAYTTEESVVARYRFQQPDVNDEASGPIF
ncbi:RES domain-containing protein [Rariglobus hedericola]|uniref:RES domain-containing protein n=1 Tax=Rariglobus hedericola TaxID=2597822 RepID=A0A556QK22_9BACT|nr:RES domain-containing protein [Rariglobus hedericola]TSJ77003.1 RES domain-containing protein [Rariglobus hedericola]